MKKREFSARKISGPVQWVRIYRLYCAAFPDSERKPFSMIVRMWRKGKTDVWYYTVDSRFAGFASTINGNREVLVDYLAVDASMRGKGVGTKILSSLKEQYAGQGFFVEIESAWEEAEDRAERQRRKRFYERCGMKSMNVMAEVFGVKMELLTWECQMDFQKYHAFYRDNYSVWAAEHIIEAIHPEAKNSIRSE